MSFFGKLGYSGGGVGFAESGEVHDNWTVALAMRWSIFDGGSRKADVDAPIDVRQWSLPRRGAYISPTRIQGVGMVARGSRTGNAAISLSVAAGIFVLGCGDSGSPDPNAIAAPTLLAVVELSSGNFELSRRDNSNNENSFEIQVRETGAMDTYFELASVDADISTYVDGGTDGVSERCYRLRALGGTGTTPSEYTPTVCLQPAPVPAPSGLSAVPGFEQVDLSWTDESSNEIGFEISKLGFGTGGMFTFGGVVGAGVTAFSSTGLLDGTEYCYRVRAVGAKGQGSDFSNTACATTE